MAQSEFFRIIYIHFRKSFEIIFYNFYKPCESFIHRLSKRHASSTTTDLFHVKLFVNNSCYVNRCVSCTFRWPFNRLEEKASVLIRLSNGSDSQAWEWKFQFIRPALMSLMAISKWHVDERMLLFVKNVPLMSNLTYPNNDPIPVCWY